jgi:hypothetical protein
MVALRKDALPKTHELSEREFTSAGYAEDDHLAAAALKELRKAAEQVGT